MGGPFADEVPGGGLRLLLYRRPGRPAPTVATPRGAATMLPPGRVPLAKADTMSKATAAATALAACLAWGAGVRSDEGMWLLEAPPRKLLAARHHFELTDAWLERARKASVRFNSGGSGGFVSAGGLIVTNHHIGE